MSRWWLGILVLGGACWTTLPPVTPTDSRPASTAGAAQLRGIVRIDPEPTGKHFQGVWLELAGSGKQWLIDHRADSYWVGFADAKVLVTGTCYRPAPGVQAADAQHFAVTRLRRATPKAPGYGPFLEVGPEVLLHGTFSVHTAPAGSKREGEAESRFAADDGTSYVTRRVDHAPGTRLQVAGRVLIPDLAHSPRSDLPELWIHQVHAADHAPDPAFARVPQPCPK